MRLQAEILDAVRAGADDATINTLIAEHIADWQLGVTVEQWRADNYRDLRRLAYPDFIEWYLDAMVKKTMGDAALAAEADDQLARYFTMAMGVKLRFPKGEIR